MEEHTRYATEDDFDGRLSYSLPDKEEASMSPTPEHWDLHAILHSVSTLRQTFERLEHAGIHIPAVCGVTEDGTAIPHPNWRELLKQIDQNVHHLDSIVIELLSEQPPSAMDSVCCSLTQ